MAFDGFTVAALDFYDDLEMDNTKSFWDANKHIYQQAVRAPMVALTEQLAEEFGSAKLFRPHRDVRFSSDKAPIKTHQGAYVRAAEGAGWYVSVSAAGVFVGGGFYRGASEQIALLRRGITDERRGAELEDIVQAMKKAKFSMGGETLKTAPRGFSIDHPRIELLRHKSLTFGKDYSHEEKAIYSNKLVEKVRKDWRKLRPLIAWFEREFN